MKAARREYVIKALALALAAGLVFLSLAGCSLISGNGAGGQQEEGQQQGGPGGKDGEGTSQDGGSAQDSDATDGDPEQAEEKRVWPIEPGGQVFEGLGTTPGNMACGGMAVTAEDGTIYAADISGSGTITRISPDGQETVICDIEPWDEMRKVTHLNIWNGCLYFEIGPVFYYTLYYATYHWPVNGIYKLDLARTDEYLKHYNAKEEGYEDLPEPVSVIEDVGAMGASYAEIGYYDPLIIGGKLCYWINNDYKKGRQLCRAGLDGTGSEELYDSKEHKVRSWTSDGEKIFVSDDVSIFALDMSGQRRNLAQVSGHHLQRYGDDLFFAVENCVYRMPARGGAKPEVMLERDGMIREFNVYDGKIYLFEEVGTDVQSSYIGIESGFEPEELEYIFYYLGDPEYADYGHPLLKGPSLCGGRMYYTQSFAKADGTEIGDVSYVELIPETGDLRETRTGNHD